VADVKADGGSGLRLFVAGELPEAATDAVRRWQRRVLEPRQDLRVNHEPHLTLCFLGLTAPEAVPAVVDALSGITWTACAARVQGPLFFPERGPRHVIALALEDPDGGLERLRSRVAVELARTGCYEPDERPWTPHVTVARFRQHGQPFPLQNVNITELLVVRMVLYSSLLKRAGAVHTPIAVFPAS
jgi:2'-5' RNA ligase